MPKNFDFFSHLDCDWHDKCLRKCTVDWKCPNNYSLERWIRSLPSKSSIHIPLFHKVIGLENLFKPLIQKKHRHFMVFLYIHFLNCIKTCSNLIMTYLMIWIKNPVAAFLLKLFTVAFSWIWLRLLYCAKKSIAPSLFLLPHA